MARKEIIDFIYDKTDTYELREKSNSWLAWLEKQGEQKPADKVEPKFKVGDVIRLRGSAAEYTIKRVTDTTYYTNGWSCGIERCEEDYELVEQKPAWSEEDEDNIFNIVGALDVLIQREIEKEHNGDRNASPKYYSDLQDWLKSLRPQNRWKPSDEQMTQLKRYCPDNRPLNSLYEQLKKLMEE